MKLIALFFTFVFSTFLFASDCKLDLNGYAKELLDFSFRGGFSESGSCLEDANYKYIEGYHSPPSEILDEKKVRIKDHFKIVSIEETNAGIGEYKVYFEVQSEDGKKYQNNFSFLTRKKQTYGCASITNSPVVNYIYKKCKIKEN